MIETPVRQSVANSVMKDRLSPPFILELERQCIPQTVQEIRGHLAFGAAPEAVDQE
jgi:hypothetical protein